MSSLLFSNERPVRDFDLSVEVLFERAESSAGILFREVGDDFLHDATFYQFEWYTDGSHHPKRLSLMRKNPYWIQLVTPRSPSATYDRWYVYRIRAAGDHLQSWLDGELQFDVHDVTFVREGRIALHCFMPREVKFRNFTLTRL